MISFAAEPLEKVRVGFVGLGYRGLDALERFTHIGDAIVTALCDLNENIIHTAALKLPTPVKLYCGPEGYLRLCEDSDVDLVYIATPWNLHTRIAICAMRAGKHVAIEVPAATAMEECWALVDTAEQTRRHCMMLENSVYDNFSLTCLNMARLGLFGELVYVEGGYIHDLDPEKEPWRLEANRLHRGDLYPTHGLGPLALALGIHRGERMRSLVSMDTAAFNGSDVAEKFFGDRKYANGDHTTTLIRTERGKAIEIQHNVMDPRPYDRGFQLTGTLGYARQYPIEQFFFKGDTDPIEGSACSVLLEKYRHPVVLDIYEKSKTIGHHDGMDFIMDYRLVYCLHHGLPLDMDVYDAAEWCSLIPLSEQSILAGNTPVEIPDFTRGEWRSRSSVEFALCKSDVISAHHCE